MSTDEDKEGLDKTLDDSKAMPSKATESTDHRIEKDHEQHELGELDDLDMHRRQAFDDGY